MGDRGERQTGAVRANRNGKQKIKEQEVGFQNI
jgi:hypothetical protein